VNLLLDAARTGTPLSASPGEQAIDLVHVEDAARAFARAGQMLLEDTHAGQRRFCVSSGTAVTLRAIAEQLEQALGTKVPVAWGGRGYREREVMTPSCSAPVLPGWRATIALRDGLKGLR
jgi:nucleoside-diphosphate-sugar epimerase